MAPTPGDAEERVAAIYERHAAQVAAYAVRRATSDDAADAVAETFLVAWRRRDDVPDEPQTLPWLYGVTRRVLANQRRTHRRRGRLGDRLASEFARHEVDQPPLEEIEEFRRVAAALNHLSPDDAELLRLTAWEGLAPSEMALVMGIAPAAARQRLRRARQRLRKHLANEPLTRSGRARGSIEARPGGARVTGAVVDAAGIDPARADGARTERAHTGEAASGDRARRAEGSSPAAAHPVAGAARGGGRP